MHRVLRLPVSGSGYRYLQSAQAGRYDTPGWGFFVLKNSGTAALASARTTFLDDKGRCASGLTKRLLMSAASIARTATGAGIEHNLLRYCHALSKGNEGQMRMSKLTGSACRKNSRERIFGLQPARGRRHFSHSHIVPDVKYIRRLSPILCLSGWRRNLFSGTLCSMLESGLSKSQR